MDFHLAFQDGINYQKFQDDIWNSSSYPHTPCKFILNNICTVKFIYASITHVKTFTKRPSCCRLLPMLLFYHIYTKLTKTQKGRHHFYFFFFLRKRAYVQTNKINSSILKAFSRRTKKGWQALNTNNHMWSKRNERW
jgi:hypothetical protein